MKDSGMQLSPACSLDNCLQFNMHFVASAPLSSLLIAGEAEQSLLSPEVAGGRSAATYMGCLFCYGNELQKTQMDIRFEFKDPKTLMCIKIAYRSTWVTCLTLILNGLEEVKGHFDRATLPCADLM